MPDNRKAPLQHRPIEEHVRKVALVVNDHVVQTPASSDVHGTRQAFVRAGYSAVKLVGSSPDGDIGAGWQPLDFFTDRVWPDYGGVTVGLNGEVAFENAGPYEAVFNGAVQHNSAGAEREFSIRAFNITDGVPGQSTVVYYVGRQHLGSNMNINMPVMIATEDIGKKWIIQYGGSPGIFTSVVWQSASISVKSISEWQTGVVAGPSIL